MKKKVFLVDDEDVIARIMTSFLEETYQVKCYSSGEACLDAINTEKPDAIILDAHMPRMNGLSTCEEVKKKHSEIPVVFLSSNESDFERNLAYSVGAKAYFGKPVQCNLLIDAIERLVVQ